MPGRRIRRGDYPEAIVQADKTMAIRREDFMQRLKAETQSQIKIQEACREAMRNAQSAFDDHDYKNAAAWAAEVLQKIRAIQRRQNCRKMRGNWRRLKT